MILKILNFLKICDKMNILIIAHGTASHPKGGYSNRIYNLALQLQEQGNNITILALNNVNEKETPHKIYEYLGNIGNRNISVFSDFNPFFIFKLIKLLNKLKVDIIQVESPWGVSISKVLVKLTGKKVKVVYSSHNYESALQKEIKEYHQKSKNRSFYKIFIFSIIYYYTRIIENLSVKLSDFVLCVSEDDKNQFIKNYKAKSHKIIVVPNGIDTKKLLNSSRNKTKYGLDPNKISLIFHGSYSYYPNFEAFEVIRDYIYPKFKNELQHIEFVIAGGDLPVSESRNGLKLLGYVDDIYSLIKSSDMAIVPIKTGGGTKLKVLDYLGMGLPIVTTKKGIEGINAENGIHALILEDINNNFVESIRFLIKNKNKRKEMSINAKKLSEEYGWEKIVKRLNEFYKNHI